MIAFFQRRELITGWWTDGYRILIEAARKPNKQEIEELPKTLFGLTDEAVDFAFNKYLQAKFPFGYKMKAVAERFGALPRGKTMSHQREAELKSRFDNTPIYRETIREAMMEKVDLDRAKQIMRNVATGKIKVTTYMSYEKPTPLAYHILAKFADVTELMAPEKVIINNIDKLKMAIDARTSDIGMYEMRSMDEYRKKSKTCPKSLTVENVVQPCLRRCIGRRILVTCRML